MELHVDSEEGNVGSNEALAAVVIVERAVHAVLQSTRCISRRPNAKIPSDPLSYAFPTKIHQTEGICLRPHS